MSMLDLLRYHKTAGKRKLKQGIALSRLRLRGVRIGRGSSVAKNVEIGNTVQIGKGADLMKNTYLAAGVEVGDHCKLTAISVGERSILDSDVICTGYGNGSIVVGKEVYIGIGAILDWSDDLYIGDFVHIAGPSTGLWTHSSAMAALRGLPVRYKGAEFRPTAPIHIENNVYIGGNCTVYPGVTIGHHSIVAPNSAVTKDVAPYSLVGGVPAKKIKTLSAVQPPANYSIDKAQ